MSIFRLSDLRQVELKATLYNLQIYHDLSDQDIMALENALRRYSKKNPHASFFIGISSTDSKTAVKYTEKTGKPGRPKTKVDGDKVKRHPHVGIIGNAEKSAYSMAKQVGGFMNKRLGKKATRVVSMQGAGFITYSYQQSDSFKQGGDFDFTQCKDDFYIEV